MKPAVFIGYFYEYRRFSIYLAKLGVKKYQEASADVCDGYIIDRFRLSHERGHKAGIAMAVRLSSLFDRLFLLGPAGSGTIPDGLLMAYSYADMISKAGPIDALDGTPIMPEATMRKLANAAFDFFKYANDIITLYEIETSFAASKTNLTSRQSSGWLHRGRERHIIKEGKIEIVKTCIKNLCEIDHLSVPERMKFGSDYKANIFGKELSIMMWTRLMMLVQHLIASCFIQIAILTGFRAGEILSMERGCVVASGSQVLIKTRISKNTGRDPGFEVERPAPNVILDVYNVLFRLVNVRHPNEKRIWCSPKSGYVNNLKLSPMLQDFLEKVVGEKGWKITSRQFRRYFGVFFVRRFQSPEDALRRHFHHRNIRPIESYVKNTNAAQYLLEAQQELAAEILTDLAFGEGNYRMRGAVSPVKEAREYVASNLPIDIIESQIERLSRQSFSEVRPTVWGYCMLQKSESLGAVCGVDGIPNLIEMFPANCGACRYLAIGKEHLGFWRGVKEMHEEISNHALSTRFAVNASLEMVAIANQLLARWDSADEMR